MAIVTGCDLSNLQFVQDYRVRFVEPSDRDTVTLPVTLRWEVYGFRVTGKDGRASRAAGYFAVFVDRDPIPPGRTLEWYAKEEGSCGDSACGAVKNLANVYTTESTNLELTRLPATKKNTGGVEKHEAVIVLLDAEGKRIGESAFYVRFTYQRTT